MAKTVAFLGLGAMGSRMAQNLLKAGHTLRVYNRSPHAAEALVSQGAVAAATPKEAAQGAQVVFAMLRDDDASREVWTHPQSGALGGMEPDAVAVECSTLSLEWARAWADKTRERGLHPLDAPVTGTLPHAEGGQLVFMVGGAASALAKVRPLLEVLGSTVHHVGPNGCGAGVKLAVNTLFATQVATLAEVLGMLHGVGLDRGAALEVLGAMPVTSPAAKMVGTLMVSGKFAPLFPVELVEKDLGYAQAAAQDLGNISPMTAAGRGVFQQAIHEGYGAQNISAVAKLFGMGE